MKTRIRVNAASALEVEQRGAYTLLTVELTGNSYPVELDEDQLADVIQALELCRDSRKRRNRK